MKRIYNIKKYSFLIELIHILILTFTIFLLLAVVALPLILIFGIISPASLFAIIGVSCCGLVSFIVVLIIFFIVFLYIKPATIWTVLDTVIELITTIREVLITPYLFIVTKRSVKVKKVFSSKRFGLNDHDFYYYEYSSKLVIKNGSTVTYVNVKEQTVDELIRNGVVIIYKDEERHNDPLGTKVFQFLRRQLRLRKKKGSS